MEVHVHTVAERQKVQLLLQSAESGSNELEEVVLNVQGYLVKADLPPILNKAMYVNIFLS